MQSTSYTWLQLMNPCLTNRTASTYKNNKQCSTSVLLWLLHQRHQWRKYSLIENSLNCCHTQLCTVISKAVLMKEEWKDNPSITFSGKAPHFYIHTWCFQTRATATPPRYMLINHHHLTFDRWVAYCTHTINSALILIKWISVRQFVYISPSQWKWTTNTSATPDTVLFGSAYSSYWLGSYEARMVNTT